jgi:hypothetical protein
MTIDFGIMMDAVKRKQVNMLKLNPVSLAVSALLMASLACTSSVTAVPTSDSSFIGTTIAQTVVAALTQTAEPLIPDTGAQSPTAAFTPTFTPTAALSLTPIFTATPSTPQITVSVATNCRVGPGKTYDRVGALLVDQYAEVFGMDSTGTYWYIRNPDSDTGYCWLWGEYATLAGNLSGLPIFTPPPTPTPVPAFDASFSSLDSCAANTSWWADLKLVNTGGIAFRSISITLRDTVTDTVAVMSADNFTDNDGCTGSSTRDTLASGDTRFVSSPSFAYDPTGHKMRATLTLCSNTAISGTCVSKVITFTP